jgi:MFS family permease
MASDAIRPGDFESTATGGVALHEVWTAFLGFFLDIYDIYLPIIGLAPAYAYFKPSGLNAPVLDSFIFASALLGRPAGALFFGYFADRLGRKRTAALTVAGAGCCVFLTGLLPGFASIGVASIIVLIAMRFATGFFAGGQYTGAVTLAMESCAPRRRGFYGALIGASSNLSFIVMAVFSMVLLRLLPAGGVDSPYAQWGWRLPFFAGAVLTFCLHSYVTRSVRESEQWLRANRIASPFRALFGSMEVGSKLLQGFLLMSGLWLACLVPAAMMPGLLHGVIGLPPIAVTALMLIAAAVTFFGFLGGGLLGDRIGRRTAFIALGLLSARSSGRHCCI